MTTSFGFLNERHEYNGGGVIIEPCPDIGEKVAQLHRFGTINGGWLYPNAAGAVPPSPLSLPDTHTLRLVRGLEIDQVLCDLLISVMGFCRGLRLIPNGWSHFYRVAIDAGMLVDFICAPRRVNEALAAAANFFHQNGQHLSRRLFAALHWHLLSQSYEHDFELFNAQYILLDTCWALFKKGGKINSHEPHATRVVVMCQHFGIPLPGWAELAHDGGAHSYLSDLRNDFFHGGYFAGDAIGFNLPGDEEDCKDGCVTGGRTVKYSNIVSELICLNSRLLLCLSGITWDYTRTRCDTGMKVVALP